MASAYGRLPLNALRVFEAVASRLSFAEAAEALNVTPAAVSQQIRTLEEYLQMPLLRRSGRKVELTPEGAQLLPEVRRGLDTLLASLRELKQMRSTGSINVSTLSSLLQRWLTPRLQRLHEQNPDLQVDWHTSRDPVDFSRSDFHAAIRFGQGPYPGLHAEKLLDEWLVAVASPEVLRKHGRLDGRADLAGLPLLHAKDEPWSRWQRDGVAEPWPPGPSIIDDSVSVLIAATEGLGFAVARWSLAEQDLGRGRLVLASDIVVPSRFAYYFVCPPAYVKLPKVAGLRDWLVREARAFPVPPAPAPAAAPKAKKRAGTSRRPP